MTIDAIKQLLGPGGYIDDPADMGPYLSEWRDRWHGATALVARPTTKEQVAKIVGLCQEGRIPIVPQGGHTGLVGGAMPIEGQHEIIISLARLNRIRDVDAAGLTITVDAGCLLSDIQAAAEAENRYFPLSLASEGSCQIGGNLSTNAGGIHVLRYGSMRDLTLGLEVVLPDGHIWNGLNRVRKNNTGYDLKHMFIGAEGTLGIITGAVLRLFPAPRQTAVALLAFTDLAHVRQTLSDLQETHGEHLNGFELIPRIGIEFTCRHIDACDDPFTQAYAWYALVELASTHAAPVLGEALESTLAKSMEAGRVASAVVAQNARQSASLWALRDNLSEVQKHEGASIKHDISVPVSSIPEFITEASAAVTELVPQARPVPFGHMGDGNIHFNISQPPGEEGATFLARRDEVNRLVHDIVIAYGGSISAEHGIGQDKLAELRRYKSAAELNLMRALKEAWDPHNIMNPGKVIPMGGREH